MLRSVLERRLMKRAITLDAEQAARERAEAEPVIETEIARLVSAGLVDDARFAEMKSRAGLEKGMGSRRILRDLERKGVDSDTAIDALKEAQREVTGTLGRDLMDEDVARSAEWEAATIFARKKRIGPFRTAPDAEDYDTRRKIWAREAGKMARAGFGVDLIREILAADPEDLD